MSSYAKAELVVQFVSLYYDEEDAALAVEATDSFEAAEAYMQQECELCAGAMKPTAITKMINCEHLCCKECAKNYFTVCIRDKTIADANCPFCSEPKGLGDQDKEDMANDYFAKLVRLRSTDKRQY